MAVPVGTSASSTGSRWRGGAPAVLLLWLALAVVSGALAFSKLGEVQENDNAAFLPQAAEATQAEQIRERFDATDVLPAIVVYERRGGLTEADRAAIGADAAQIGALPALRAPLPPPLPSADGEAVQLIVPLGQSFVTLAEDVRLIEAIISDTPGVSAYVTGPAGIGADFGKVFRSIDSTLLFTALGVVALILLVVYRSWILWLLPLFCAVVALVTAGGVVYLLARADVIELNGQSNGILNVLVIGAGTDYALLLIARYREELHRHESTYAAMRVAWRGAAPAIVASGLTVILGLLCLLVSQLKSNQGLGPVGSIGIAAAMAVMLTLLPALLLLLGRKAFWPFVPQYGAPVREESGIWGRISAFVGRRPRPAWMGSVLLLGALALGMTQLRAEGLSQSEAFTADVSSVSGQEVLERHYPAGSGSPATVFGPVEQAQPLLAAVRAAPGVVSAELGIDRTGAGAPDPAPRVVDGYVRIEATLADPADSRAAQATVTRLRQDLDVVSPTAVVGGFTAVNADIQEASRRDRAVIIPLVLVVIFLVLAVLLRALVAPVLLIATVVLSFAATLGVSAWVFNGVFDFPGADSSFPLFAFVFLVALGIDYNIFLMTRVREESETLGTRAGTLRALAVTGGVITSAGVVLAATFAVLGVLPLVFLAQLGFAVAFGVLLDTLLVRSVLVPALAYDLGRWTWWPGRAAGDTSAPAGRSG